MELIGKIKRNYCTHSPTPIRVYYDAQIRRVKPDRNKAMGVELEFKLIPRVRNMRLWKQKQHWREFRGLKGGGALLALIDAEAKEDITVIFFRSPRRTLAL